MCLKSLISQKIENVVAGKLQKTLAKNYTP